MTALFAPRALLPDGWADDVRFDIAPDGSFADVRPGSDPGDAERLAGPVIPGIPDLHSHAFQRAMAGRAESAAGDGDDTFWGWRRLLYRFLERLGPEEVEAVSEWLFVEMLRAGYTAVGEFHYLHLDPRGRRYDDPGEMARRVLAGAARAGIGLTILPVLYRSGGFGGAPPEPGQRRFVLTVDELLDLYRSLRADVHGNPRFAVGVAPHSLRAVSPEPLADLHDAVELIDPGCPLHIHAAEQEREVEACVAWSGARPVEWLLDNYPVDDRWCIVHATHIDEDEIRRLAASGAVAGLCPTTEANLGDGLFPLPEYLDAGGSMGIGSDSHVSVSPVEELRWLEYGQRLRLLRRTVAAGGDGRPPERSGGDSRPASTGAALLRRALEGGRRALARPVGRLAAGSRADLVVLDPDHPDFAGLRGDGLLDAWIFSGNANAVRDVIVGGEWRVREGRHPREEKAASAFRDVLRAHAG